MALYWSAAQRIPEGQITATIYGQIRDGKFAEATKHLQFQLQNYPTSRAALSLLAFCHYSSSNFDAAASTYAQLSRLVPSNQEYQMHQAQCLYKAGLHAEATKLALSLENTKQQSLALQLAILYDQEDMQGCKRLLDQLPAAEASTLVAEGCLLYKDRSYAKARQKFLDAISFGGHQPELTYNAALCSYQMKQHGPALKQVAEIIERGIRDHPDLAVGAGAERAGVRSVGNSQALKESALVEAFNLKAAIECKMKNLAAAREALIDMPPRAEAELDPVTLHNIALVNMDTDPNGGFRKLTHLLQSPPFPPVTFANLLLLYCKPQRGLYDLAADVMAENPDLLAKLPQARAPNGDLQQYLDAAMLRASSPEEAYRKLDELAGRHVERLRRLTKQLQDARLAHDSEATKAAISAYEEALEGYIPVLMLQAHIYWDRQQYSRVQQAFQQSAEFCSEHETWRLNLAHTLFMQDQKFKEVIHFYEPIVRAHIDDLLSVTAIVLANLCVSYIMTSQNEEAEALMRKVEQEEELQAQRDPSKHAVHLCIINLVIGTLYCAKGNFPFGIVRVMKSMEPLAQKLETDTWFYVKRCFLALVEGLTKHMIALPDPVLADIMHFLAEAERWGKAIPATFQSRVPAESGVTVAAEARLLTKAFLELLHQ
eukprot:jgi/Astpho2/9730/fgenesh1_pm.00149_%23_13_t